MPAVTAETLALPRIRVTPGLVDRPVARLVTAEHGVQGEGFPVRFPDVPLAEIDPFVLVSTMGDLEYAPGEAKGTAWHPHRGFETVTYMIDGALLHQDTYGGGGAITDGDTQWMTAGSGLLHIETPPERLVVAGGAFHAVQLWVNLPAEHKWTPPRYQGIPGSGVTLLTSPDGGALVRLIAGEIDGHTGPGRTWSPITLVHLTLTAGASITLPWPEDSTALAYALAGRGRITAQRHPFDHGRFAVLGGGGSVTLSAADTQDSRSPALEVLLLGGRPLREPVEMHGPFVMNTRAEVVQAFEDHRAGRLGTVPPGALMPYVPPGSGRPV